MKFINLTYFILIFYYYYLYVKVIGLFISKKKKNTNKNKVLYLAAFFPNNAGYIYRVKKWADILSKNGYEVDIKYALPEKKYYDYLGTDKVDEISFYLKSLKSRVKQVLSAKDYDIVIVRRELLLFNDYGNLFLEKLLVKINPNTILDFDDDIAYAKQEPKKVSGFISKILQEHPKKFTKSITLYKKFIVGSAYLKEYVLNINKSINPHDICIIPTCVDYEKYEAKQFKNDSKEITLGWIGSNGNLKLLDKIIPELNLLHQYHPIKLIVISGKEFTPNTVFEVQNYTWSYKTQINDLLKIDIGLMPLNNSLEDKGKSGFKLLQYMGLGIVGLATAITINKEIIDDKVNGFLISEDNTNWLDVLKNVVDNKSRFEEIGRNARKKIKNQYSFKANKGIYLSFMESCK